MSKVTSKRQVTIPKEVSDLYGIRPGDEIDWIPHGHEIRVVPAGDSTRRRLSAQERLALFDLATRRRDERAMAGAGEAAEAADRRGWTREELHERGRAR